jgi:PHD/YefM family antitoxin component YafN of YafNO toxin-antitoxin module
MTKTIAAFHTMSVTDAATRGVAALVREAEEGTDVVVERRHQPVAAVISVGRLEALREAQRDLRDIGLVLTRAATDTGERVDLDTVIARFGYDRAALEAELDEDLAAGRE